MKSLTSCKSFIYSTFFTAGAGLVVLRNQSYLRCQGLLYDPSHNDINHISGLLAAA
jgi:hypothetical protein